MKAGLHRPNVFDVGCELVLASKLPGLMLSQVG